MSSKTPLLRDLCATLVSLRLPFRYLCQRALVKRAPMSKSSADVFFLLPPHPPPPPGAPARLQIFTLSVALPSPNRPGSRGRLRGRGPTHPSTVRLRGIRGLKSQVLRPRRPRGRVERRDTGRWRWTRVGQSCSRRREGRRRSRKFGCVGVCFVFPQGHVKVRAHRAISNGAMEREF